MATINVTFHNFSDEAELAFRRAAQVWEQLLVSNVTIEVNATMSALQLNGGLVGVCIPNGVNQFTNPPNDTWYVSALADALTGQDQKPGEADMDIFFSPTPGAQQQWNFSGNPPTANEIDFETVALHEMCHGLGFVGLTFLGQGGGSYGALTQQLVDGLIAPNQLSFPFPNLNNSPSIFGWHYRDQAGHQLVENVIYPNPSANLGGAYTSDAITYAFNTSPPTSERIYCPHVYAFGSSMDHLDDSNSLMYYSVGSHEIRYPDDKVLRVLASMGWQINVSPPIQVPVFTPPSAAPPQEDTVDGECLDSAPDSQTEGESPSAPEHTYIQWRTSDGAFYFTLIQTPGKNYLTLATTAEQAEPPENLPSQTAAKGSQLPQTLPFAGKKVAFDFRTAAKGGFIRGNVEIRAASFFDGHDRGLFSKELTWQKSEDDVPYNYLGYCFTYKALA